MDKIMLIDAHNQMWRASINFGRPNKNEEDFSMVFNFFRNMRPLFEMFQPDKCFFVLEGHPKFRYDLYPDYKKNRIYNNPEKKEVMDNFHKAKRDIIRLMKYHPVTSVRAEHYECDDVIATLCENLKDEQVTVISSDNDYIQLLQKNYKNLNIYDPIKKAMKQAPEYNYVSWKSIVGDKSDNISGFPGIGDKRAQKLMGNLDNFQKFMAVDSNRKIFDLNKSVIEFRQIPIEEIVFENGISNFEELRKEFLSLGFQSFGNDNYWNKYTASFNSIQF